MSISDPPTPAGTDSPPTRRAFGPRRLRWILAVTLGFTACSVVTLRSPLGDAIWPGPVIGAVLTKMILGLRRRREGVPSPVANVRDWRGRAEAALRFVLMAALVAGAYFAVGYIILASTFHD